MNIRLRYSTTFVAGVWFDEQLVMSNYSVDVTLVTQTLDPQDNEVALERVKYFFGNELHSTLFVNQADTEFAEAFSTLNVDITTLPTEPVDQVVGIALYYKLNAIMEGRMKVSELVLCSEIGDNIEYFYGEHDKNELFTSAGWWNNPGLTHSDLVFDDDEEVEELSADEEWKEVELSWAQTEPTVDIDKVILSNFNLLHNETKH
jgi:hypothetical protein